MTQLGPPANASDEVTIGSGEGDAPRSANGLARVGAITIVFSVLGLLCNLVTGILIARALGAHGRGEYAVLLTIPTFAVWLFSMGVQSAASFHVARHRQDANRLTTSWLAMGIVLIGGGMLVVGLLAPVLVSAQDGHVVWLLRLALLTMIPGFTLMLFSGVLMGDEDYTFVNLLLFLRLVLLAVVFLALEFVTGLTVTNALLATIAIDCLTAAVAGSRVLRRYGVAKPDRRLALRSLWYGFRVHGNTAGGQITTRLDLFIMPSLIGASSIGQYAVATNVSSIVVSIGSFLPAIVLPAAARRGRQGSRIVVTSTFAVLAIGMATALVIGAGADIGVRLIYGDGFSDSVLPLRLLLGGTVAFAGAQILAAGIAAADRPFTAGLAQLPAVVITVAGLALFLKSDGITAAAIISTLSYIAYFLTALLLYRRVASLRWRELVPSRDERQRLQLWARGRGVFAAVRSGKKP